MLCQNPPQDLEESANCNVTYHQWLQTLSSRDAERTLTFSGGAGGGGASFFGYRDSRTFLDIRVWGISGGGGGSSAILNLSVVQSLPPSRAHTVSEYSTLYRNILDANSTRFDPAVESNNWYRGYRVESTTVTAGAGGGSRNSIRRPSNHEDGRAIGRIEDFAIGGTHCARNDNSYIPLQLRGGDGGFGGGGGGCGGGGGGGGYTGGAVLGNTNTTPGGGGYSFHSNTCNTTESCNVPPGSYTYNTEDDGYVDIVAADCGCVYECVVYEEEDQFGCLCPNNTQLAPDLSDCYYTEERRVVISELETMYTATSDVILSGITFGSSVFVFSVDVSLRTSQSTSGDGQCALLFVGHENNIVLATNVVIGSGTATTLSEVNLNLTSGALTMTDYTSFLNSSVLVTGAVLASKGDCEIKSKITFVRSMQESANQVNFTAVVGKLLINSDVLKVFVGQLLQHPTSVMGTALASSLTSQLLQLPSPTPAPSPHDGSSEEQSVADSVVTSLSITVAISTVLVIVLGMSLIAVIIVKVWSKASNLHLEPNALEQNKAYDTADPVQDEIPTRPTENGAQSQQNPTDGGDGIEIIYDGVKYEEIGSEGESSRHVHSEIHGNDGESDYYVN